MAHDGRKRLSLGRGFAVVMVVVISLISMMLSSQNEADFANLLEVLEVTKSFLDEGLNLTEALFDQIDEEVDPDQPNARCAIALFGLPRAFESVVLPSLLKNVVSINAKYGCDYFIHQHQLQEEKEGRHGRGGTIDIDAVHQLEEHVDATIQFSATTEQDFLRKYDSLLEKIRTVKDDKGKLLYYPWRDGSYKMFESTTNIIKMWHGIESAWNLMDGHAKQEGIEYSHVGVFRLDVAYMSPIDMFEFPDQVVIPAFAAYPVNDRCAYGPIAAIRIWASERFKRLEAHVKYVNKVDWGYGLHSERFIGYALLPPMFEALNAPKEDLANLKNKVKPMNGTILESPTLCFFRVRADESLWTNDCRIDPAGYGTPQVKAAVESVVNRSCKGFVPGPPNRRSTVVLDCSTGPRYEKRNE